MLVSIAVLSITVHYSKATGFQANAEQRKKALQSQGAQGKALACDELLLSHSKATCRLYPAPTS